MPELDDLYVRDLREAGRSHLLPGAALRPEPDDEVPYCERICRHGLRFDVHCRECSFQGYCGCDACEEDES